VHPGCTTRERSEQFRLAIQAKTRTEMCSWLHKLMMSEGLPFGRKCISKVKVHEPDDCGGCRDAILEKHGWRNVESFT
jgi:hypothetical protein